MLEGDRFRKVDRVRHGNRCIKIQAVIREPETLDQVFLVARIDAGMGPPLVGDEVCRFHHQLVTLEAPPRKSEFAGLPRRAGAVQVDDAFLEHQFALDDHRVLVGPREAHRIGQDHRFRRAWIAAGDHRVL